LQELNQSIGIKLLTSGFLEKFWFLVAISSEGQMPVLPPLRTPMTGRSSLSQSYWSKR